ncbi:MAG: hypothetical protein RBR53_02415 [Desulforegulaceae bacterium]|nr:hypothetical protein [Desulforegulaceae bacterium]
MKKNWTIFNGLLAVLISLMLMTGCSDHDHSTAGVESGKVIQGPVKGATVFLDINGDRKLNQGEPSVKTKDDGSYTLNIPKGKEGLICSVGGALSNTGAAALPMLAPRDSGNITALTTLVAINPGLKATFGPRWNSDPYEVIEKKEPNGTITRYVDGSLLQVKFVIEILQSALASAGTANFDQFSAMTLLAGELLDKNIKYDIEIKAAVTAFLGKLKERGLIDDAKAMAIQSMAFAAIEAIDDKVKPEELEKVAKAAESKKFSRYGVNFSPPTALPFPNDLAWASSGGKVVLPISDDTPADKKVLYTAINKLENEGLSPNTPISIPLTSGAELVPEDIQPAVKIFNLSSFTPVTDFTVAQDNEFIKIYPTKPFDGGTQYAVVLQKGIKVKGLEGVELGTNPVFEMIKPSFEEGLPDVFAALQPLKDKYERLFFGLANYEVISGGHISSIPEDEILMLSTFTTAEKTLSVTDFATILVTVTGGADPDSMTIEGLEYSSLTSEYGSMLPTIPLKVHGNGTTIPSTIGVEGDFFKSWNVSSLSNLYKGLIPVDERVQYKIFYGDKFTDSVVVFQHGLGREKNDGAALAGLGYPVMAMDLPHHGDRVDPEGGGFLTSNLPMNRINLYQSFYDMSVFVQGIKSGKFDIDGDGTPDAPANIYFAGQSMGSITGSVMAKYNPNYLDKVVLNAGGANFAAILDTAKNASLAGLVKSLGIEKNTIEYFTTLGVLQLIMDPCDPAYLAKDLTTNVEDTIFQFAYKDTVVSNVSNEIFANVAGAEAKVELTEFSTPADFENNKAYVFGGKADKKDNWIPHGFLLSPGTENYPEAKEFMDDSYITDAYTAVGTWTADYLSIENK